MKRLGGLALLFALSLAASPPTRGAEHAVKGAIALMVPPTYDQKLRDAGLVGDVRVVAAVGDYGFVVGPLIESRHPELAAAVRDALRFWFFQPPACVTGGDPYEARFTVAFTQEADRFFVTVKDVAYLADGPGASLPPSKDLPALKRISGDDPRFPRKAFQKRRNRAWVIAKVQIDDRGAVTSARVVSFPDAIFDDEVQSAVMEWRFEPWLDATGQPEAVSGCVQINFTLVGE